MDYVPPSTFNCQHNGAVTEYDGVTVCELCDRAVEQLSYEAEWRYSGPEKDTARCSLYSHTVRSVDKTLLEHGVKCDDAMKNIIEAKYKKTIGSLTTRKTKRRAIIGVCYMEALREAGTILPSTVIEKQFSLCHSEFSDGLILYRRAHTHVGHTDPTSFLKWVAEQITSEVISDSTISNVTEEMKSYKGMRYLLNHHTPKAIATAFLFRQLCRDEVPIHKKEVCSKVGITETKLSTILKIIRS